MNILFSLWFSARSALQAFARLSDRQEQRDVESYLCKSQSFAELEYRERHWMQSH
ncbi:MAG: hypothetical protein Q7T78_23075 [Rhodoferax sp.]|nr:hypothetical protein [Rhodoferax sp.]